MAYSRYRHELLQLMLLVNRCTFRWSLTTTCRDGA